MRGVGRKEGRKEGEKKKKHMEKRGLDELRGGEKGKEGWGGEVGAFVPPAGKRRSFGMGEVEGRRRRRRLERGALQDVSSSSRGLGALPPRGRDARDGNREQSEQRSLGQGGQHREKVHGLCGDKRGGKKAGKGRKWAGGEREQLCFDCKPCPEPGDSSCSGECLGPGTASAPSETPKIPSLEISG